jgi:hypothetical protein
MQNPFKFFPWVVLSVVCIYVVAYFHLVRVQATVQTSNPTRCLSSPGYGAVPSELFAPIHCIDKRLLRPRMWSYRGTMDEYHRYMGWAK